MGASITLAEHRFAEVVEALLDGPGVTLGTSNDRKGFGSSALCFNDKVFAMVSKGQLVVKLPRQRVDALVAAGRADRFDPGHGRFMKEWLAVAPDSGEDWITLAREAMAHAAAQR